MDRAAWPPGAVTVPHPRSNRLRGLGLAAIALTLALSACSRGETQRMFGLERTSPDEFQVVRQTPLSVPPDFRLRPPQPGAERPAERTVQAQARDALFGDGSGQLAGATGSASEQALLARAGADSVDPSIRRVVDQETLAMVDAEDTFLRRLIFWQDQGPSGTLVDPAAETRRLRENAATGLPVTEGETPIIRRRERGFLEGLL